VARKKRKGHIAPGRKDVYKKLKKRYGKRIAAAIANAGRTFAGRSRMAKKAARTRKRRGR
jgi:hypothetical protein